MSTNPKNFLDSFPKIEKNFLGKKLILILDFDGTLTRIRKQASAPKISQKRISFLRALSNFDGVRIIILSGRPLSFLKKRVPVKNAMLIPERGIYLSSFLPEKKAVLEKELLSLKKLLLPFTKSFRGSTIELKPTSLVFHFRNVEKSKSWVLERKVLKITKLFLRDKKLLKIVPGRMSLEFLPRNFPDKGDTLRKIMNQHNGFFIYAGDDETDEPAFKQVSKKGIGILLRSKEKSTKTTAKYYLNGMSEMDLALNLIYNSKKEK